jgi:hypothetical protein
VGHISSHCQPSWRSSLQYLRSNFVVFIFLQKYSTNFVWRGEEKYGGNTRPVAGPFQAGCGEKGVAQAAADRPATKKSRVRQAHPTPGYIDVRVFMGVIKSSDNALRTIITDRPAVQAIFLGAFAQGHRGLIAIRLLKVR